MVPPDPGLPFDEPSPAVRPPLSVSELTSALKHVVETQFGGVTVQGEVSNCRTWSSGHIYFTLKDHAAQIRAVIFRMSARQLTFALEDGLRVVARGRVSLYEVKGEYQLICDALDLQGLGRQQAAFEQLKRRLEAEGLFAAARKRPLPLLPRRIGIVTSADGAALRDILRVLSLRHPGARVVVRPARVQGEEAPADLVRALRAISRVDDLDVVIIGRGGGSSEDLWAFNDEALARAIAACPVPVVSAVGHEIDFTIADFVADVRAATPSNAAELVVERADHFRTRIDGGVSRLRRAADRRVRDARQRSLHADLRLERWPARLALRDRDVEDLRVALRHASLAQLARRRSRTDQLRRRLEARDVRRLTAVAATKLARVDGQLRALIARRRAAAGARAAGLAGRLDALSPLAVLGRGYAVCWNAAGTSIIRSASAVRRGDDIRVTLGEGELLCRVDDTNPRPRGDRRAAPDES